MPELDRIDPDTFAFWWQTTFAEHVDISNPYLKRVQEVWESFGEVDPEDFRWVQRLQATAAKMDEEFFRGSWEMFIMTGLNYLAASDCDARARWRKKAAEIKRSPSGLVQASRQASLSEEIHEYFRGQVLDQIVKNPLPPSY